MSNTIQLKALRQTVRKQTLRKFTKLKTHCLCNLSKQKAKLIHISAQSNVPVECRHNQILMIQRVILQNRMIRSNLRKRPTMMSLQIRMIKMIQLRMLMMIQIAVMRQLRQTILKMMIRKQTQIQVKKIKIKILNKRKKKMSQEIED